MTVDHRPLVCPQCGAITQNSRPFCSERRLLGWRCPDCGSDAIAIRPIAEWRARLVVDLPADLQKVARRLIESPEALTSLESVELIMACETR